MYSSLLGAQLECTSVCEGAECCSLAEGLAIFSASCPYCCGQWAGVRGEMGEAGDTQYSTALNVQL